MNAIAICATHKKSCALVRRPDRRPPCPRNRVIGSMRAAPIAGHVAARAAVKHSRARSSQNGSDVTAEEAITSFGRPSAPPINEGEATETVMPTMPPNVAATNPSVSESRNNARGSAPNARRIATSARRSRARFNNTAATFIG